MQQRHLLYAAASLFAVPTPLVIYRQTDDMQSQYRALHYGASRCENGIGKIQFHII